MNFDQIAALVVLVGVVAVLIHGRVRSDVAALSAAAALTLPRAQAMAEWGHARQEGQGAPKRHLVFAPAKYLSNAQLRAQGIEFAALPFALFRQG